MDIKWCKAWCDYDKYDRLVRAIYFSIFESEIHHLSRMKTAMDPDRIKNDSPISEKDIIKALDSVKKDFESKSCAIEVMKEVFDHFHGLENDNKPPFS